MPPSSNEANVTFSAAALAIFLPVATLPVKEITSASGLSVRAAPAVAPRPVTMETTPFGTPASSASLASSRAVQGVSSCGFSTIAQPAMRAGAIFRQATAYGKFHAMTPTATPAGCGTSQSCSFGWSAERISPSMCRSNPA